MSRENGKEKKDNKDDGAKEKKNSGESNNDYFELFWEQNLHILK